MSASKNRAALSIQCFVRGLAWRRTFVCVRHRRRVFAAEGLLSLWRRHWYSVHRAHQRRHCAAALIQRWFVSAMTQRVCCEYKHSVLSKDLKYVAAVRKAQAILRGKMCRNEMRFEIENDGVLVNAVRRAKVARREWRREDTVNYRLKVALNAIGSARTLFGVSSACDTLSALLSVAPNIGDRIAEHDVIGSLFGVLRNSNRSVPHLNLVAKILKFLLFFARHSAECYAAIFYRADTLDILSERLQIHRLDLALFELATQLFFVGVHRGSNRGSKGVSVSVDDRFVRGLRGSAVIQRQIRTVQKIMASKLEISRRINRPLRRMANAKQIYKVKFEQERILALCVRNMDRLVERL